MLFFVVGATKKKLIESFFYGFYLTLIPLVFNNVVEWEAIGMAASPRGECLKIIKKLMNFLTR